jgi:hypothetical protein
MVSPADGAATTQTVESRKARFMAIPRGHQFEIEFDSAFPQGLVLIGDVAPDNEYQTREDKAAGRPVRQKIDNMTGERQWKATATDPDEPNANGRHSKSRSSRTSSRFRLARRFCRVCVPSSWQG